MEEIDKIRLMFHRLMMSVIHDCHFRENINTRYINKIIDYIEIKPEFWINYRVSNITCKKLDDFFPNI